MAYERQDAVKLAEEFLEFCRENRSMRFWQALLSWSGLPYIAACESPPRYYRQESEGYIKDTFHFQGKNS